MARFSYEREGTLMKDAKCTEGTVSVLQEDRISLAEIVEAVRLRDWTMR